jgi:gag-polypeptide of LTR copia-type
MYWYVLITLKSEKTARGQSRYWFVLISLKIRKNQIPIKYPYQKVMSVESTGNIIGINTTITVRDIMDVNTSLKLTSMLLNDKNYQAWAKAVRISLKGKGKLGYINGTRPKPIIAIEAEEWEVQDSLILSWLLHSMEPNISEQINWGRLEMKPNGKNKIKDLKY